MSSHWLARLSIGMILDYRKSRAVRIVVINSAYYFCRGEGVRPAVHLLAFREWKIASLVCRLSERALGQVPSSLMG